MMARVLTADELRGMGREPLVPFRIQLDDGSDVIVERLLRVLPGRRIVGEGYWNEHHVLAKLFVSSHSSKECAEEICGIKTMTSCGIPTPRLLGEMRLQAGGSVLLTEFLPEAESLAAVWARLARFPAGHPDALAALLPVFSMLGRMHAKGLTHKDLHFGNFLVDPSSEILVIDGDAVQGSPGKRLTTGDARRNLALLMAQLPCAWDRCIEHLLAAYGKTSNTEGRRFLPNGFEADLHAIRARRLRHYLSKTLRDCTEFSVTHDCRQFISVVRDVAPRLKPLLDDPDQAIRAGELLKDGATCSVAKVQSDNGHLVIKRYNLKDWRHAISRCWRPSRAWRAWQAGHALKQLEIDTPEPLALIEERAGPLRKRAFLVMAFCAGHHLAAHLNLDAPPPEAEAKAIIGLFETLCRESITHGDLKASNLLWVDGKLVVIDLDAMRRHGSARSFIRCWKRDRARLLRNWPESSELRRWLNKALPPA